MFRAFSLAVCCSLIFIATPQAARPADSQLAELVAAAGSDAPDSIARLRQLGPAALEALLSRRDALQARLASSMSPGEVAALEQDLTRLEQVIDQVGRQRYCSRSRLFWHTDLDEAKQAAITAGKPILSLRMLGNLTDELSCANSRFFRTTLYANAEISSFLRENFILHWQSVRPVPVVTIDFGDGRKLKRTLTGNSIHYVLTPGGEIVDALPGLYGPAAFLARVTKLADVARQVAALPAADRSAWLVQYHQQQWDAISRQWARDWQQVSGPATARLDPAAPEAQTPPELVVTVAAADAARIAAPKGAVEMPLLRGIAAGSVANPEVVEDENAWQRIAALHEQEARLDAASRELIASENPTAAAAGRLSITKRRVEDPMLRLVRTLESSIAVDTVRNEYQLHRRIHQWLADPAFRAELESFNDRVYAELFLTPKSDPWLGLAPADAYTALRDGGVVAEASREIAE